MSNSSNPFETLKKILFGILKTEGLSIAREKGIVAGHAIIHTIRLILLLHYTILIVCFMTALSLFSCISVITLQYSENNSVHFNAPLSVSILVFIVSSLLLGFSVRKQTWNKTLKIEDWIDSILGTGTHAPQTNAQQLEELVSQILAKKLGELASASRTQSTQSKTTEN